MNRFGAFAVHLGISVLIFLILGYIILFHWYPDFFFTSDGGWQGIRIVAFVDLVLGPVLTLVVFKKGKPSLRFDLTCIAVLQAVCLTAGMWVVYSERPIAMVFADGSFQSMTIDDFTEAGQPTPHLEGPSPQWVSVRLPADLTEQSGIRRRLLNERRPLKTMVEYYVPFDVSHIDQDRDGISQMEMERIGMEFFDEFLAEHSGALADYLFLPFSTRYVPALLAYHLESGEMIYQALPLTLEADRKESNK